MSRASFWGSLEIYCVCADMDYERDYLNFHKKERTVGAPLCKKAFESLRQVVHAQMKHDFKEEDDTSISEG